MTEHSVPPHIYDELENAPCIVVNDGNGRKQQYVSRAMVVDRSTVIKVSVSFACAFILSLIAIFIRIDAVLDAVAYNASDDWKGQCVYLAEAWRSRKNVQYTALTEIEIAQIQQIVNDKKPKPIR